MKTTDPAMRTLGRTRCRGYNAPVSMSDSTELRALAKRLGNPLAADGEEPAADVIAGPLRDRATADDRESARVSLERKLRDAKAAQTSQPEA